MQPSSAWAARPRPANKIRQKTAAARICCDDGRDNAGHKRVIGEARPAKAFPKLYLNLPSAFYCLAFFFSPISGIKPFVPAKLCAIMVLDVCLGTHSRMRGFAYRGALKSKRSLKIRCLVGWL